MSEAGGPSRLPSWRAWRWPEAKGAPAMPRIVYLLGVGIGLVVIAFALTCRLLGAAPGVPEANARLLRVGMPLQEVEALLGGPGTQEWRAGTPARRSWTRYWYGNDVALWVELDGRAR